ncbi:hypothetical protein [Shewanella marina]|uniref:hypothetical protein n=1 Tax=Shewanella marina TaxID=487319 RepID=UPI000472B625|nr:hypothetical protein [Shewanella marina]
MIAGTQNDDVNANKTVMVGTAPVKTNFGYINTAADDVIAALDADFTDKGDWDITSDNTIVTITQKGAPAIDGDKACNLTYKLNTDNQPVYTIKNNGC